jgi:hypothetical protein
MVCPTAEVTFVDLLVKILLFQIFAHLIMIPSIDRPLKFIFLPIESFSFRSQEVEITIPV